MGERMQVWIMLFFVLFLLVLVGKAGVEDVYEEERLALLEELRSQGINEEVLKALARVPRQSFVPEELVEEAYHNIPLPIGNSQTISQPYVVALMTQELGVGKNDKVLEVGTGRGYQAVVLAGMVGEVYTIEIVEDLAKSSKDRLAKLGYDNVHVKQGDGYFGWPEQAPFDAIIITAAVDHVPPKLLEQLKINGKMVLPLGSRNQVLTTVTKLEDGQIDERKVTGVIFVPFTGAARTKLR